MRTGLFYYIDWTWLLLLAGFIIAAAVQLYMKSTVKRFSKVESGSGLSGAEAARAILNAAGVTGVAIVATSGELTDHYDPRKKVIALSESSYSKTSLTAIGVAAHECGHAIQDAENYGPLNLRNSIVPVANIGSQLSWPIFVIGLIFSIRPLLSVGIILFCAAVIFQLVTLPVEFNASSRALKLLGSTGIMRSDEIKGSRKVLSAAALTYVAALAVSILQLLRLVILAGGRNRD
ncbi:MAG: zinc metallopeptidase [Lachnospiraceae bacterium]|jgi:Zn-dependent membrane protease YugP